MPLSRTADLQDVSREVYEAFSVANGLTAVGTNQATALALTSAVNRVTTAASGTGVVLPQAIAGRQITIFNDGANAIKVYGSKSGETIDGQAYGTGVTLTNAKRCEYYCVAAGVWLSAQLGVVSA